MEQITKKKRINPKQRFYRPPISRKPNQLINTTQAVLIYLYLDRNNYHKFRPDYSSQFFGKSERVTSCNPLTIKIHLTPSCKEVFLEQEVTLDGIFGSSKNLLPHALDLKLASNRDDLLLPQSPTQKMLKTSIETKSRIDNGNVDSYLNTGKTNSSQMKNEKEKTKNNEEEEEEEKENKLTNFQENDDVEESDDDEGGEENNMKIEMDQTVKKIEKEKEKKKEKESKTKTKIKQNTQFTKLTTMVSNVNSPLNNLNANTHEDSKKNKILIANQTDEINGMSETINSEEEKQNENYSYLQSVTNSIQNINKLKPLSTKEIRSKIEKYFLRRNLLTSREEFNLKIDNQINSQWRPPGNSILTYKLSLIEDNNPLTNLEFEVFSGTFQDHVLKKYFHSIQHILKWFVLKKNVFDFTDQNWNIYFLFEKIHKKDFCSRNYYDYNCNFNNNYNGGDDDEMNNNNNNNDNDNNNSDMIYILAGVATSYSYFNYPDSYRCRLNNFVILTPYRTMQNEFNFLNAIYLGPLTDFKVKEITSEIITPSFPSIRSQLDLLICWKSGFFSNLKMKTENIKTFQILQTFFWKKNNIKTMNEDDNEEDDEEYDGEDDDEEEEDGDDDDDDDDDDEQRQEFKNKIVFNNQSELNLGNKKINKKKNREKKKRSTIEEQENESENENENESRMVIEKKLNPQNTSKNLSESENIISNVEKINYEKEDIVPLIKPLSEELISKIKEKTKLHRNQIIKCYQISLFNKLQFVKNETLIKTFRIQVKKRLSIENMNFFSEVLHKKEWLENKYRQEITEFQSILSRIQKN
ncbi:histone acetyltransferase type b catalytic subunit [Anaeramoeba flamelloides]|uniref:Histone acetyltransferase type b catalytic subunit n=1 Tax=Anaeramoeba flamelloides TaxID=1746091 RepID=A0AAV7ZE11_9EUKA|nr:histone acetyltransferase type b catalytic subunit [Anaeramoeba flamelloides]